MTNVICEYIWLDANKNLRSKTNILLNHDPESGFPIWNYDVLLLIKQMVNHQKFLSGPSKLHATLLDERNKHSLFYAILGL